MVWSSAGDNPNATNRTPLRTMNLKINQKVESDSKTKLIDNLQSGRIGNNQSNKLVIDESRLSELAFAAQAINLLDDKTSTGFQIIDELIGVGESSQGQANQERGRALTHEDVEGGRPGSALTVEESMEQPHQERDELLNPGLKITIRSRGMEILQETMGLAGRRRSNPVDEVKIIDEAPHGAEMGERAQAGQEGSRKFLGALSAIGRAASAVFKFATGDDSVACDFAAFKVGVYTSLFATPVSGAVAGAVFNEVCQKVAFGEGPIEGGLRNAQEETQKHQQQPSSSQQSVSYAKAHGLYTENPLQDPIDENDLEGTRDYELRMQVLAKYKPTVDPHENDSDSSIGRVIDGLGIVIDMDLFQGGTSTGSFQEEGTIRFDQNDFARFLGTQGGTSTGDDQLI